MTMITHGKIILVTSLVTFLSNAAGRGADEREVTLTVVDEAGCPVAGAELGSFIGNIVPGSPPGNLKQGELTLRWDYGPDVATARITDCQGQVKLKQEWLFDPDFEHATPLIACTKSRTHMGIRQVKRTDLGKVLELRMQPTCEVKVSLTCRELERLAKSPWSTVSVRKDGLHLLERISSNGEHQLYLPQGDFDVYASARDTYSKRPKLEIKAGEREKRIDIDLAPTRIAQLVGKPAPEFTQIKGWKNGGPVKLADLKGKVVILDFWGHWCGPCIYRMPELMELHDKYADKGLVIIAVHDDSVENIEEMEKHLDPIRKEVWKGRDLPFLVALDGGGEIPVEGRHAAVKGATTAAYGVPFWPTCVLIDRDGKVQGTIFTHQPGYLATIEQALGIQK